MEKKEIKRILKGVCRDKNIEKVAEALYEFFTNLKESEIADIIRMVRIEMEDPSDYRVVLDKSGRSFYHILDAVSRILYNKGFTRTIFINDDRLRAFNYFLSYGFVYPSTAHGSVLYKNTTKDYVELQDDFTNKLSEFKNTYKNFLKYLDKKNVRICIIDDCMSSNGNTIESLKSFLSMLRKNNIKYRIFMFIKSPKYGSIHTHSIICDDKNEHCYFLSSKTPDEKMVELAIDIRKGLKKLLEVEIKEEVYRSVIEEDIKRYLNKNFIKRVYSFSIF